MKRWRIEDKHGWQFSETESPTGPWVRFSDLKELSDAVNFLKRCKAEPDYSNEVGAMKDAVAWLESAACYLIEST